MFFQGIVESISLTNYGTAKVRIFGKHTEDKTILPTDDLPDAKILYPAESSIDEISYFRTITPGTWVIISFLDKDEQFPIILGSIVKTVNELPNFTQGFTDENSQHPDSNHLTESTISRLARNENIADTISQTKTNGREVGLTSCGTTFSQPANPYNTVYPNNRVLQTKKHIIEIDDTDGSERINIYHYSGTFVEIHPDGTQTEKIKGTKFLSVENDFNIITHGNINVKSDGNINIQGDSIGLNGTADNLVAFTDMQTAFNNLRSDVNTHITNYNGHMHPTAGSGLPSAPTVLSIASTTTMDSAVVSTVTVPWNIYFFNVNKNKI